MAHEELLLENQICFRVYSLEKEIQAAYRPILEELGLTYAQYITMLVLWEKREASVGEVCAALSLDTGTVSPLLKRLEASGLIRRRRAQEDERTVMVSLSPEGEALEERARRVPGALVSCLFPQGGAGEGSEAATLYLELRRVLDGALARLRSKACTPD